MSESESEPESVVVVVGVGEVRYVMLTFDMRHCDVGEVHPASTFLRRMKDDHFFKYDVGAVDVTQISPTVG